MSTWSSTLYIWTSFQCFYVHSNVNESLKLPFAAIALPTAALLLSAPGSILDYTKDLKYIDVCMFLKQLQCIY